MLMKCPPQENTGGSVAIFIVAVIWRIMHELKFTRIIDPDKICFVNPKSIVFSSHNRQR